MKDFGNKAVRWPCRPATAFVRNEDGIIAPLVLVFFFLMLVIGGIAVDVMRFETQRVAVQNTLDRATLAAASMEQALSSDEEQAEAVVRDWFAKAGVGSALDSVTPDVGLNYKIMEAKATVKSNNFFMSMLDVPYLQSVTASRAEQRVTNVEIALVLDVSGSMVAATNPNRLPNLKTAAKDFVDTVLDADTENKISISIVPYNGQVLLGPTLISKFNVSGAHSLPTSQPNGNTAKATCLDLPPSVYSATTLSRSTAYPQAPFLDAWALGNTLWSNKSSGAAPPNSWSAIVTQTYDTGRKLYSNVWCNPVSGNYVRLHNNNRTNLKAQIDGLVGVGATSIDLGMKWGTFLLDPSSRSINAELSEVPSYFKTRPAEYDDRETMKVLVLMTDGANFDQQRVGDDYRGQLSPIWRANDGKLSIFHASKVNNSNSTTIKNSRPFWVPDLGAWHQRPWNGTTPTGDYSPTATYTNTTQQTWNQVWSLAHAEWVAWQMYARALCSSTDSTCRKNTFNTWMNNFATYVDGTKKELSPTMDARLNQLCTVAKSKGIIVFGIAFEAAPLGKTAIKSCASEPSKDYYFDVAGLNIKTAFSMIASKLSQLRLTQ